MWGWYTIVLFVSGFLSLVWFDDGGFGGFGGFGFAGGLLGFGFCG